ncbi:hypothetical protein QEH59_04425 [Coraliomargarita sp. SDUM461004]|uniref:HNH endonuclease n=1 Tax=Thalassobacterium sedimentorum TaxID=3041258 RepID=A0ABU1AGE3_9BACT|nr:hypothetical protein [Coraliomargarita sp. SDUM461004]MDQ8193654.1 hypothetical protein [Coraliomargarita sp. SDUM461004]
MPALPVREFNIQFNATSKVLQKFVAKKANNNTQWWHTGPIMCPQEDWLFIFKSLNYHCVYCLKALDSSTEELITAKLDHIIPPMHFTQDDSPDHEQNLVPCCCLCAAIKQGITIDIRSDRLHLWSTRKAYLARLREIIKEIKDQVKVDTMQYVDASIHYPWDDSPEYADFVD